MTATDPKTISLESILSQADAHHQAGRLPESQQLDRTALQVEANHSGANYNLGMIKLKARRPTAVSPHFNAAIETDSRSDGLEGNAPSPHQMNELATLFNQRQYGESEALARALTDRFPRHGFGWKVLGAVFMQTHRIAEALESMITATSLLPEDAEGFSNLGITFQNLHRYEEAETAYRAALKIKPDFAEAHNNLGNTLQRSGRLEEAEGSYKMALQFKPHYAVAHSNLGATLQQLGRLTEAEASYRLALITKPDLVEALNRLVAMLIEQGRAGEAYVYSRKALDASPSSVGAKQNLYYASKILVPGWHVPMMNEEKRNKAYFSALKSAVVPSSNVFEIGTGSGILAMMAAKLGAKVVTTCETESLIAETAQHIVAENGYEQIISVIPKRSGDIEVGADLSEKADILLTEIFSNELLGENVIKSIEDAKRRLLKPGARVIPAVGSIMIALFGGKDMGRNLIVEDSFGFKLQRFNSIVAAKRVLNRQDLNIEMLTDDIEAFRFNFETDSVFPSQTKTLSISITAPGRCYGIIQWIQLHMDDEIVFANHPLEKSVVANWQNCVYVSTEPLDVKLGEVAVVSASHDRTIPWFSLDRIEVAERA